MAEYYYLDADGQSVRGPFNLADVWALRDRQVVSMMTPICQAGTEAWQPLTDFPELRPKIAQVPPPSPARPRPASLPAQQAPPAAALAVIGGVVGFFVLLGFYISAHNKAAAAAPFEASSTPSASASSWDDGYSQAVPIGKAWAAGGHTIPTAEQLQSDALRACRSRVHPPDEDQWVRGFQSGFEVGYKEVTKPAF